MTLRNDSKIGRTSGTAPKADPAKRPALPTETKKLLGQLEQLLRLPCIGGCSDGSKPTPPSAFGRELADLSAAVTKGKLKPEAFRTQVQQAVDRRLDLLWKFEQEGCFSTMAASDAERKGIRALCDTTGLTYNGQPVRSSTQSMPVL